MVTLQKAFDILEKLGKKAVISSGIPDDVIDRLERLLEIKLPVSYRLFLNNFGTVRVGKKLWLGVSKPVNQPINLINRLWKLRKIYPQFPKVLVPIYSDETTQWIACLRYFDGSEPDIICLRLNVPWEQQKLDQVASNFSEFLLAQLTRVYCREQALRVLDEHVRQFESSYLNIDRFPPNDVWRPYRFCVRNVVIGLVVVRLQVQGNFLEVDVCLTSDIPEYTPQSGAKITTLFLLSEAYKCGTNMSIRFTPNVEEGRVPESIVKLADELKIKLAYVHKGWITSAEARLLYIALTGFAPAVCDAILKLSDMGRQAPEMICYLVNHSVWSVKEAESIILTHPDPPRFFKGQSLPEQRHLYLQDLHYARAAILGKMLDLQFTQCEHSDDGGKVITDLEDNRRLVNIELEPDVYARIYWAEEPMSLSWNSSESEPILIQPFHRLVALIRPRTCIEIAHNFKNDLSRALSLKEPSEGIPPPTVVILYPRDFDDIALADRNSMISEASMNGVLILTCPETLHSIDIEANRRLSLNRLTRK